MKLAGFLGFGLILTLGYIGYDLYHERRARDEASNAIKGDSVALVAIRDTMSRKEKEADSLRTDIRSLQERYLSERERVRTKYITVPGKSDTTISDSGVKEITRTDTVYAPDSAAIRALAKSDSIIKSYKRLDLRTIEVDSLHHAEVRRLENINRNITNLYVSERTKNKKKTFFAVAITAAATYGGLKLAESLIK